MKKQRMLSWMLCFWMLLFCGCGKETVPPACRVVTQVDIFCQHEDVQIRRHYTQPQKMEYVLLYLRLLKPQGMPQIDPEQVDADVYEITVKLSDGEVKRYRQKDHRYFSEGSLPWQTIDPEQASQFYRLLGKIPSDEG